MTWSPSSWRALPAEQQPVWPSPVQAAKVRDFLSVLPPLTTPARVRRLAERLRRVQAGEAFILQAGDCAEPFGAAAVSGVPGKHRIIGAMARTIEAGSGRPVVQVGRMAGQFAKPRSQPIDTLSGRDLPSFRGLIINGPEPVEASRRPDPQRMLAAYHTARLVLDELGRLTGRADPDLWTSHEALLLDYEEGFARRDPHSGEWYLLSTDLPWIGERTRQLDGAHIEFLSAVANPIACKIGPGTSADELLALCEALGAWRAPGRLTLIPRMGAQLVRDRLHPLVRAVRDAGYPVVWMCDPMHGNPTSTTSGLKTRLITDITEELSGFVEVMHELGERPGGVHLEVAGEDVTECLWSAEQLTDDLHHAYRSLCDARLNNAQAAYVTERLAAALTAGMERQPGRPAFHPALVRG